MNYFVLENGESSVFGNIKRKAINELNCMFFYAGFFHPSFGCKRNEFTLNKEFSCRSAREFILRYLILLRTFFPKVQESKVLLFHWISLWLRRLLITIDLFLAWKKSMKLNMGGQIPRQANSRE